jgi:hypothetical protein
MMGGSSGGSPGFVRGNPAFINAAVPSVSQGPYNAAGAVANAVNLAKAYPWITPSPQGAFAGALPGAASSLGGQQTDPLAGLFKGAQATAPGSLPPGITPTGSLPPTTPSAPTAAPTSGTQPNNLAQIIAALTSGGPKSSGS